MFLAQTRNRSHLGCILLFRNSFQYPQSKRYSKRVSKRLSRVVAFIVDLSVSRVQVARKALLLRSCIAQFHPKHNSLKGVSKQLGVYHLYRNVFLAQRRIKSPFFPRFRKAFLTPYNQNSFAFIICKYHPESCLETLILHQKSGDKRTLFSASLKCVSNPHNHSPLLCGLFKLENATTLAF